jgi:hypothetical protein
MGCGLHKLDVNTAQDSGGAMVSPPEDAIEFEDRLNIFWGVYSLDCLSALFASVPSALPAEEVIVILYLIESVFSLTLRQDITTCWPLSWQFYEQVRFERHLHGYGPWRPTKVSYSRLLRPEAQFAIYSRVIREFAMRLPTVLSL